MSSESSVAKDAVNETSLADIVPSIENISNIATSENTFEGNVTTDDIKTENVTTDINTSDTLLDVSSVTSDGNDTLISNLTDSAVGDTLFADETFVTDNLNKTDDMINALNESVPNVISNDTNILSDVINEQTLLNDNLTSFDTVNVTSDEKLPLIDNIDGNNSLTFSLDGIIDVNNIDSLPAPIDLPPPPIDFDPAVESGLNISDIGTNVSDTFSQIDMNTTLAIDTNDTSVGNKTYIDQVDIYIEPDTGNMTMVHTPVETFNPDSALEAAVDVPPVPVPIDLPPPPVDKPSVDFIETQGSTTIEISDLLTGLGAFDKASPPMNIVVPDTTTAGMAPIYPDVPGLETTTVTPIDMFTTSSPFVDYVTTTVQPGTLEPAHIQHMSETGMKFPLKNMFYLEYTK